MKILTRRPVPSAEPQGSDEDWAIDEGPGELAGWSTGARANTSTLLRFGLWGLLILGPVLGLAAFLSVSHTPGPIRPTSAPSAQPAAGAQGAAGFAQLFVAAFLSAGEGDQNKLAAYYPPAAGLRLEGISQRRTGEQLTVVRLRQTDRDVWSVTVAARIASAHPAPAPSNPAGEQRPDPKADAAAAAAGAVHYFQVPVATAAVPGGASGYVALSLPAEVTAPARIQAPQLVYGPLRPALPSDPRTQAVTQFLNAYLTGAGGLDRYLAPGTQLTAISPVPYTDLAVDQLAIEGESGGEAVTGIPADGTRLRLLVQLRARSQDGIRIPLNYALTLSARAGRWEIAALDGAPAPARVQATAPAPAASPGASTATPGASPS
ncbi:conjugal transfer protein [Streptomyces sp. NPDC056682]|uniref:conjugal transfer protein n=1 Tax=Streptomyces sp. NPDC056682 TaxID=3345909 RepID=UPI0036AA1853